MIKVIWSTTAKRNFKNTVDYLFENWTIREVENFRDKVEILILNISKNHSLCPKSNFYNLRKCKIDRNNSLIYFVEKQTIFIVTIINSRSLHPY